MFVFYDVNGKITSAIECTNPNATPPSNPGTPLYLDDTQYANVWNDPTEYTIQNGVPVSTPIPDATKLASAKTAQITQLRQGYGQTLSQGFQFTIGTTAYTFGWSTDDKTNLLATQEAITDGFLTFPIQYADIHGNPVSIPDQTTLTGLKQKATSFFNAQHQQILNDINSVSSATTVSGVTAITWTPATY